MELTRDEKDMLIAALKKKIIGHIQHALNKCSSDGIYHPALAQKELQSALDTFKRIDDINHITGRE